MAIPSNPTIMNPQSSSIRNPVLATATLPERHCRARYNGTARSKELPLRLRFHGLGARAPWHAVSAARNDGGFEASASLPSLITRIRSRISSGDAIDELEKVVCYSFRSEVGGLVKVLVGADKGRYSVNIEVSSLPESFNCDLSLNWGIFRSDSSSKHVPTTYSLAAGTSAGTPRSMAWPIETNFAPANLGHQRINLGFDPIDVPFYLAFVLCPHSDSLVPNSGIRTHRKTAFCVPVGLGAGRASAPLGVSVSDDGSVNFSLFSRNAERVVLCLYADKANLPSLEIELDPYVNRTGDIWHVSMGSISNYTAYGYRCRGRELQDQGGSKCNMDNVLFDPYAKNLVALMADKGPTMCSSKFLGQIDQGPAFDWSGDVRPSLPMEKLVVYRLNVAHLTKDKSSGVSKGNTGTFAGVIQKLQHFKNLGVNAILLEPVFPFDEQKGPYFPHNFFSVMNSYGGMDNGGSAAFEMKDMIKALHAHGIEVFLEVVFSHTAEGEDATSKALSFRGIDNSSYYYSGNGDIGSETSSGMKCYNPVLQQLILDSLRHWLTEFHIDGFSFINAAHLVRGANGDYLSRPPLVEAIAYDPLLRKTKIIADCWSPHDAVYVRTDFPHWKRWAEMNLRFCDDVRKFLRGDGLLSDLATRLCGSGDIFSDSRGPAFSFNFIARNSGLSLVDLVSFSDNDLGAELSWNCGEEGPTSENTVLETRVKQMRNFLFILFISLGVPVLNMGDEFGQSNGGSLLHGDRRPINWTSLRTTFGAQMTQFIRFLTDFRKRRGDLFQKREFLKLENIDWHGSALSPPMWEDPSSKFLAVTLKAEKDDNPRSYRGDVFMSFNAGDVPEFANLPELELGYRWSRLVDTSLPFPGFFSVDSEQKTLELTGLSSYPTKPHSCAMFEVVRRRQILGQF